MQRAKKKRSPSSVLERAPMPYVGLAELIHRIVFAASLERRFTREIALVVVAHIRASHILVFDTRELFANFSALHASDIGEHALIPKVAFRKVVCAQRCCVIGRQGN